MGKSLNIGLNLPAISVNFRPFETGRTGAMQKHLLTNFQNKKHFFHILFWLTVLFNNGSKKNDIRLIVWKPTLLIVLQRIIFEDAEVN